MTTVAQRNVRNLTFPEGQAGARGDVGEIAFISGLLTNWWYEFKASAETADGTNYLNSRYGGYQWVRVHDNLSTTTENASNVMTLDCKRQHHKLIMPIGYTGNTSLTMGNVSSDINTPCKLLIENFSGGVRVVNFDGVKDVYGSSMGSVSIPDGETAFFAFVQMASGDNVNTFAYPATGADASVTEEVITNPTGAITPADDTDRLIFILNGSYPPGPITVNPPATPRPGKTLEVVFDNGSTSDASAKFPGFKHMLGAAMPDAFIPDRELGAIIPTYKFFFDNDNQPTLLFSSKGDITETRYAFSFRATSAPVFGELPNYFSTIDLTTEVDMGGTYAFHLVQVDDVTAAKNTRISMFNDSGTAFNMEVTGGQEDNLYFDKSFNLSTIPLSHSVPDAKTAIIDTVSMGKPGEHRLESVYIQDAAATVKSDRPTTLFATGSTIALVTNSATGLFKTVKWKDSSRNSVNVLAFAENGSIGQKVDVVLESSHATDDLAVNLTTPSGKVFDPTGTRELDGEFVVTNGTTGSFTLLQVSDSNFQIVMSDFKEHSVGTFRTEFGAVPLEVDNIVYDAMEIEIVSTTTDNTVNLNKAGAEAGRIVTVVVSNTEGTTEAFAFGGDIEDFGNTLTNRAVPAGGKVMYRFMYNVATEKFDYQFSKDAGDGFILGDRNLVAAPGDVLDYDAVAVGKLNTTPEQDNLITIRFPDAGKSGAHLISVLSGINPAPNVFSWDNTIYSCVISDERIQVDLEPTVTGFAVSRGEVLFIKEESGVIYVDVRGDGIIAPRSIEIKDLAGLHTSVKTLGLLGAVRVPGTNLLDPGANTEMEMDPLSLQPGEYIFSNKSRYSITIKTTPGQGNVSHYRFSAPQLSGGFHNWSIVKGETIRLVVDKFFNVTFEEQTPFEHHGSDGNWRQMDLSVAGKAVSTLPRDEGITNLRIQDDTEIVRELEIYGFDGQIVNISVINPVNDSSATPYNVRHVGTDETVYGQPCRPTKTTRLSYRLLVDDPEQKAALQPINTQEPISYGWIRLTLDSSFGPGAKILINGQNTDITLTPVDNWVVGDKALIIVGDYNNDSSLLLNFTGSGDEVYDTVADYPSNVENSQLLVEYTGSGVGFIVHKT